MEQWVALPIAVALAGLVQVAKGALAKQYHRYIPVPLIVIGPAVGAGLSFVMGGTWQEGVIAGVIGSAGAAFGYDFVHGLRKSMIEPE